MNAPSCIPLAEAVTRTAFELGRIQSNADWILPAAFLIIAVVFTRQMYRRDGCELGRAVQLFLTALRTCVFLILLLLYLQPQWRAESERTVNSRVVLLADTSLSMGLSDMQSAGGNASRSQYAAENLQKSDFINRLRERHDLVVYHFDEKVEQTASLPKLSTPATDSTLHADTPADDKTTPAAGTLDWPALFKPRGVETRLSDALRFVIQEQRDAVPAAVICISDGCQNMGTSPQEALSAAQEAKIPVHTLGVGSDRAPLDVRVSDLVAPARAYPGDSYTVTGFVQGLQAAGKTVTVELLQRPASDGDAADKTKTATGELVERREITLPDEGKSLPVKFELTPQATGRQTLCFRVAEIPGELDPGDNFREADVEIVDKKCRVLIFAGGPSREYQFLRNMLHRDESVEVDVFLQTAQPGMSQDAHAVLDNFPATREQMFKYDCVVAMDPNWRALNDEQLKLLEDWVAEQGGGLLVEAGAVHMGNPIDSWIGDERMDALRNLYPVTFHRRFAVAERSRASKDPQALQFTRDGLDAEFLRLGDDPESSRKAWAEFPGVFSFYPVAGIKPGAVVYARFSDPSLAAGPTQAEITPGGADETAYFAAQFYGSGHVFYMAGSEMWRLRRIDEAFFEQFYTKLIRHLAQGRLLRGNERGTLLVDRERYMLGGTVEVRARLTDAQLAPLEASAVPLTVLAPDGNAETVSLKAEAARKGAFAGRVPLVQEGVYRLELVVPESDDVRLSRRIQVNMPDLERQNPQRNDALLSKIAASSGGRYFPDLASALQSPPLADARESTAASASLLSELKDRSKTIVLTAAPDPLLRKNWLLAAMILICVLLSAEWLIRRIMKLA